MRPIKSNARTRAFQLARENRGDDLARGHAVLVGNRAGVVEWASDAWSRLTGFPLDETLDKPISHFLDQAGLEIELVDFVAQQFLEGRSCTVESGFETFDGRHIQVHLEVEPHRDPSGDLTRFIAVASNVPEKEALAHDERSDPAACPEARPNTGRPAPPSHGEALKASTAGLSKESRSQARATRIDHLFDRTLRRIGERDRGDAFLEVIHEHDAPLADVDATALEELLHALMRSTFIHANGQNAFVTAISGRLEAHRLHRSLAHPVTAVLDEAGGHPRSYLEIHDTGPTLDRESLARIVRSDIPPAATASVYAIVQASQRESAQGALRHQDSSPGCGTTVQWVGFVPTESRR